MMIFQIDMVQRKGERLQRLLPYRRLQFTFPYHDGMPSHFSQPVQHLMVPLPVPPDLLHPEPGVRFRHHIIFAPLMSVPEAPVHQNTGAVFPQHDVRLARQPRMIEPIPESPTPQKFPDKNLRFLSQMDKMVKRGITELVTPGVAMGDNVLNYKENNFLAAVHFGKTACGVSFLDISTGEFLTGEGTYDYVEKLMGNFMPKEVLYDRTRKNDFEKYFGSKYCTFELDDWVFTEQTALQKLLGHFKTKSLKGFGVEHLKNGVIASGAIMQYLEITQHTQINHITALSRIEEDKFVRMDRFTIRSLELVAPMQEDGSSLLNVIDRTVTAMGGRMLRRWLVFPLKDVKPINERLDIVEYFFKEPEFRQLLDDQLHRISDLERIISKVAVGRVSPREVVQLKNALEAIKPIKVDRKSVV